MAIFRNVTVTMQAAGNPTWQPGGQANGKVNWISLNGRNQVPGGFLNNAATTYIITGTDAATGANFQSNALHEDIVNSDPDNNVYIFQLLEKFVFNRR